MVVIKVVHNHLVNEKFMGRFQRETKSCCKSFMPYIIELTTGRSRNLTLRLISS
jgi:hypothetical protein